MALAPAAAAIPTPVVRPIGKADRIVVLKRKRTLLLMREETIIRSFRVALGREPSGAKQRQGDFRTPEGVYRVAGFNPSSYFHRAILVSYPSPADVARARSMGVSPGGAIMIHGLDPAIAAKWQDDHWLFNWTRGCIAVTNDEIEQIWESVEVGTPIDIRP